jgi:pimeloyl-ACP methyl ester carboxylesterase
VTITPTPETADVPLAADAELGEIGRPTPHWPGRRVTSGGVTLHVRETPGPVRGTRSGAEPDQGEDADTVVFVHGLGGSATNWTDLAGGLSSRFRGVAVDLPGFGRSDPPAGGDYSIAAHADAVLCFLAGMGRDSGPVHLVGNSLGGAVALTVAARRPELVRTLTLVSPAMPDLRPAPSRLGDPRMALALLPVIGAKVKAELQAEEPATRLTRTMRLCYADPGQVTEEAFALAAGEATERAGLPHAADALQQSFTGLVSAWLAPRPRSLWTTASRVRVPTLVVWGESDRLVSVRKARRTTAALPLGRLLRLPGVGHVAQMERPRLVARAVLGMIDAAAAGTWTPEQGAPEQASPGAGAPGARGAAGGARPVTAAGDGAGDALAGCGTVRG